MKKWFGIQKAGENSYRWMLTFSDLSTLLLTFFVMIVGISLISEKKVREIFLINSSKGTPYPSEGRFFNPIEGIPVMSVKREEINLIDDLSKLYEDYKGKGNLKLYSQYKRLKLIIGEKLLFDAGKVDLKKEAYPLLDSLYEMLSKNNYFFIIEGHTDSTKPSKITNMELSVLRAITVLRYLSGKGIPLNRMAIAGYGDIKPLYPEDTPEGRAKNRRVEITIFLRR